MQRRRFTLAFAAALACWVCAGCSARRAIEADRPYQAGIAQVSRIDVRSLRGRPAAVHVTAYGQLPDACTRIDRTSQQRRGSGIDVTLTTRRESGDLCPLQVRPFDTSIGLDVTGFPPGLYFVSVNGVQGTFEIFDVPGGFDRNDRYPTW